MDDLLLDTSHRSNLACQLIPDGGSETGANKSNDQSDVTAERPESSHSSLAGKAALWLQESVQKQEDGGHQMDDVVTE